MANPGLILSYRTPVAVPARRFVALGAAADIVVLAGVASIIVGASEQVAGPAGGTVDVIHQGVALVEAGAAVALAAPVQADAQGRAVTSAPAAGVNAWVGGIALESAAAAGDLIRVLLTPHRLQG